MKAGRELDARIAKLMGWEGYHDLNYVDGDTWYSSCKNCVACAPENEEILSWNWGDPPIPGCEGYPPYSTSIAAALPVLEWLRQRFFSVKIIMWDHKEKILVIGHKRQGHDENIDDLEVEANTLPLAICLAALKATSREESSGAKGVSDVD